VEIDALQEVAETDENNNVFTQQLPIPTPYVSCTATPEETLETPTAETPEGTPTATLDPNVTPTATVYPGVLLSLNSGFEDDVENDKVPDNWKLKNFTSAKRVCNKVNRPGKPDKIVAYSGNCALQIKSAGKLSQTLNAPFSAVGSDLYAALAFNAKGVTLDMFDAKVKVVYSTPPNGTINLKPEALNEGWTPNSSFLVVQIDQVSKFKLLFTAKAGFSGKLILDDFILSLQ
jgi:hypothetical protein